MSYRTVNEPIDAVITWVDGEDPEHKQKLERYLGWRARWKPKAAATTRYADRGELEYCIASLIRFAPWLRHIFIVTDEQTPSFLSFLPTELADQVSVVDHKVIFGDDRDKLPTFNSLSIETMLWRIPDLANNFIYLNDDCFLVKPVGPESFFKDGRVVLRGKFRPLIRPRVQTRIKHFFRLGRLTLRRLQSRAASLAGFTDQYLDAGHIPHPMRVSTFHDYFKENPQQLLSNSAYPLRSVRQFSPIALANHLEIKSNMAKISALPESLYLGSEPGIHDVESLIELETRSECRFLCAQSLDKASEEFMGFWVPWMNKVVGSIQRESR